MVGTDDMLLVHSNYSHNENSFAPRREPNTHTMKTALLLLHRSSIRDWRIRRVGQEHYIYGVHAKYLAGKPPSIQSFTVYIHGSGQP